MLTITNNTITSNLFGIYNDQATNSSVYHNNFIGNTNQAVDESGTNPNNTWDNGYPSGGNYWSNHTGVDINSGVDQDESGSDGIADTPYDIAGGSGSKDYYPFMNENGWATTTNQRPKADANGPYEAITDGVLVDIDPDTLNINSKGKWVTAYLVADPDGTALVKLDGTGSSDPDEDELASYSWTVFDSDDNVIAEATGAAPEVELPAGEFEVELMVNDGQLDSESASTTTISVNILDVASVDPSQITLLGPNEDGSAISGVWGEMQEDAETLMVKFSRAALIPSLSAEEENSIEVGVGGAVAGEDTIMVIERGGGKGKNK